MNMEKAFLITGWAVLGGCVYGLYKCIKIGNKLDKLFDELELDIVVVNEGDNNE